MNPVNNTRKLLTVPQRVVSSHGQVAAAAAAQDADWKVQLFFICHAGDGKQVA